LDLTGSQCFWLVHRNDWSRWFSVSRCDDSANMMKMHWLVEILRAFSHVIYKRQNSMVNEITLWSIWRKGIDWLITSLKNLIFLNYNFFSLTKVILNLIIFAPLVRNFVKMTHMHTMLSRTFQWYQKHSEGPYGLRVLMCDHKTKQTTILIQIYRYVWMITSSHTTFQCNGWNNATPFYYYFNMWMIDNKP
jgi:hypothetical protein